MKADTEAAERERVWAEAKEKVEIARVASEAREKAESDAADRAKAWAEARRRRRLPGSLPRRVKMWRPRQRQESRRKPMMQREQRKRLPLRSYPRQMQKEKIEIKGRG